MTERTDLACDMTCSRVSPGAMPPLRTEDTPLRTEDTPCAAIILSARVTPAGVAAPEAATDGAGDGIEVEECIEVEEAMDDGATTERACDDLPEEIISFWKEDAGVSADEATAWAARSPGPRPLVAERTPATPNASASAPSCGKRTCVFTRPPAGIGDASWTSTTPSSSSRSSSNCHG